MLGVAQNRYRFAFCWITLLCVCVWSHGVRANAFDEAITAYDQKNYDQAFQQFTVLAKQGHAKAQYNLGLLYAQGIGTSKNLRQALYWYKQAAQQKHINAMYNIGYLYQHSKKPVQDYKAAMQWYLKAAQRGSRSALVNIGEMYFYGQGMAKKDYIKAYAWFSLAASRGSRRGFHNKDLMSLRLPPMDLSRGESLYRQLRGQYLDPFLK